MLLLLVSTGRQATTLCVSILTLCVCVLIKISHLSFAFCVIYLLWYFHSSPHFSFLRALCCVLGPEIIIIIVVVYMLSRSFSPKSTKHVTGIPIKFSQDELSFLRYCGHCFCSLARCLAQASTEFLIYFAFMKYSCFAHKFFVLDFFYSLSQTSSYYVILILGEGWEKGRKAFIRKF